MGAHRLEDSRGTRASFRMLRFETNAKRPSGLKERVLFQRQDIVSGRIKKMIALIPVL